MPLLAKIGVCELAFAALTGWVMIATLERPEALIRAGFRHLGRIRQAHLDLLMMGTILTAVGVAADPVPTWIGVLLVTGALVVPLMLGALAVRNDWQSESTVYRAVNIVVLLGFSVAWVGLAVTVLGR